MGGARVVAALTPTRPLTRYARLARAAARGDAGPRRVVDAMRTHPLLAAGTGRPDPVLTEGTGGRMLAKQHALGAP